MSDDVFYRQLVLKMREMSVVPPQTFGPFTPLYKRVAAQFKIAPWRSAVVLSTVAAVFLYLTFGVAVLRLASLLQGGF